MSVINNALGRLGWNDSLAASFAAQAPSSSTPARVAVVSSSRLAVLSEHGHIDVPVSGALRAAPPEGGITAGAWVAVDGGSAVLALPRQSVLLRRTAGGLSTAQAVAANLDTVFIAVPLGLAVGVRRLERSLAMAWSSGARPVVLLTKADLSDGLDRDIELAGAAAAGVPVIAVSALGRGLDDLRASLPAAATGAIIGPSGAGKSTLINALRGDDQLATAAVRADGRGRHTTTHRELIELPGGALLIDTPGMRELGIWDAHAGIDAVFSDVTELAGHCRFRDCAHEREPGCAVRAAARADPAILDRVASMRKLEREQRRLDQQVDARQRAESRLERRRMGRALRRQPHR